MSLHGHKKNTSESCSIYLFVRKPEIVTFSVLSRTSKIHLQPNTRGSLNRHTHVLKYTSTKDFGNFYYSYLVWRENGPTVLTLLS